MSACTVGVAVAVSASTGAGLQCGQILPQHPIVGPEVMPPLRNAMRLINRNQRRFALRQHLRKPRHPQPLRRNKQKLQLALQIVDAGLPRHRPVQAGVNSRYTQPQRGELCRLVFHQRNQRRNHQRGSAQRNRRQLVAQRFSRARGHHQQQVAAYQRGGTHGLLVCPESRKPKHAA